MSLPKLVPMTEKDIQDQIIQWLGYQRGWFGWRQNQSMTIANYTTRFGESKRRAFRSASVDGISDIIGLYLGTAVAIEVKKYPNKPKPDQITFLEQFSAKGGLAMVCYSLEDCQETFKAAHDSLMFAKSSGFGVFWNREKHMKKPSKG